MSSRMTWEARALTRLLLPPAAAGAAVMAAEALLPGFTALI